MISIYDLHAGTRSQGMESHAAGGGPLWIDVHTPTFDEAAWLRTAFGVEAPDRDEIRARAMSRQLRRAGGRTYMTATALVKVDSLHPQSIAITWVLAPNQLFTIRHGHSLALSRFAEQSAADGDTFHSPYEILVETLGAVIARQAALVKSIESDVEELTATALMTTQAALERRASAATLRQIGRAGEVAGRAREALVSLGRVLTWIAANVKPDDPGAEAELALLRDDVRNLVEQVGWLSGRVNLLLDATLGAINIQQNNTIRTLSIVATIFLPPTLIASVFGMNFQHMPWLETHWGFLAAIAMMVASAIGPLFFFRR